MSQPLLVLCTCPDRQSGLEIARALCDQHLAACTNLLPGVVSVYHWQGKIMEDEEVLLLVKTRAGLLAQVEELIRSKHVYQVPEVIALPITAGSDDYLHWMFANLHPLPAE